MSSLNSLHNSFAHGLVLQLLLLIVSHFIEMHLFTWRDSWEFLYAACMYCCLHSHTCLKPLYKNSGYGPDIINTCTTLNIITHVCTFITLARHGTYNHPVLQPPHTAGPSGVATLGHTGARTLATTGRAPPMQR